MTDYPHGFPKSITKEFRYRKSDLQLFSKISGDLNPLHLDHKYAKQMGFDDQVSYGALTIAYLSNIVGMHIPGEGALWSDLRIKWLLPIYPESTIIFNAKVTHICHTTNSIHLDISGYHSSSNQIHFTSSSIVLVKSEVKFTSDFNLVHNDEAIESPESLSDKFYLISGYTGSIGSVIVKSLLEDGFKVIGISSKEYKSTLAVKPSFKRYYENMQLIHCCADLSNTSEIVNLCKRLSSYGIPLGFIHCACSPLKISPISSVPVDGSLLDDYILSVVSFHSLLSKVLEISTTPTRNICILSDAIIGTPPKNFGFYTSLKVGLLAIAKQYAIEHSSSGHRFNCIAPGLIDNSYSSSISDLIKRHQSAMNPAGRLTAEYDILKLVKFLLSDDCFVNGQLIPINGGAKFV